MDHPDPREGDNPIRRAIAIGIVVVSLGLGVGTCSMLDHIGRAKFEQAKGANDANVR